MSARSMKRARQRQIAKEQRRSERLGRRSKAAIGAGAALGATVLFAPSANADQFTVNTLADAPPTAPPDFNGTLRDALYDASQTAGHDIVSFDPALNGTITLTEGQLRLYEDTEIIGPGRDVITVSGNDQSRVFYMSANNNQPSVISGLTITGGNSGDSNGGGVFVQYSNLILEDVAVTGNETIASGGGIFARNAGLEIHDSTISGNAAGSELVDNNGGGIYVDQDGRGGKYNYDYDLSPLEIRDTTVSGNSASGHGGGIFLYQLYQGGTIRDSAITGNDAGEDGGGIYLYNLNEDGIFTVENTDVSTNDAIEGDGGGMRLGGEDSIDGTMILEDATVSGNTAADDGGGIYLYSLSNDSGQFISRGSTLSGNTATDEGGGIAVDDSDGVLRFHRSTISGNTAGTRGGGVYLQDVVFTGDGSFGVAQFHDSTIASNSAADGGGIFNFYDDVLLRNTIVADNTNDDIEEAPVVNGQTFLLDFSLIEDVGDDADVAQQTAGSNILGQDPQLGPLADNGGPTLTHLPAFTSPAVDQGSSNALIDQRHFLRPFDQAGTANPNLPGADGSDIGAVELQAPPPEPPQPEGSCKGQPATVALAPVGEVTFGTAGRDVIVGNAATNEIRGRGGNDLICGRGGRDQLNGGPGDDEVLGEAGNDVISGDQDDDTMRGGAGNDKLSGATGNDRGFGNGGQDRLTGAAGNDRLNGNANNDVLIGAAGADTLNGGPGNDRLNGGQGVDQLNGGGGNDQEIQQRR
jgi:Ca2+-binding RTX toxin-like protein